MSRAKVKYLRELYCFLNYLHKTYSRAEVNYIRQQIKDKQNFSEVARMVGSYFVEGKGLGRQHLMANTLINVMLGNFNGA